MAPALSDGIYNPNDDYSMPTPTPPRRVKATDTPPPSRPAKPVAGESDGELDFAAELTGNLNDAAYEQIRQALIEGRFRPGQTFTIRALGSAFGTSPMPVRDALKRLLAEHALEMRRNRSVMVPIMSRKRFQEILQIRLQIEPDLAARATPHMTPELLTAMADDHSQMCEAKDGGDLLRFLRHNRGFHFRLYRAADTVMLYPLVESLWTQIGPHLREVFTETQQTKAPAGPEHHHLALLRALRRQDPAAASQAVFNDIAEAADAILATVAFAN